MMNDKLKKTLASVGLLGAFGLGGAALAGAQGDQPAAKSAASQPAGAQADEREQGDERDQKATGADADRAGQAALKATGGGKVLSVERDAPDQGADVAEPGDKPDSAAEQSRDQKVAYDVEVQKTDGTTAEVELDSAFKVLSTQQDEAEGTESGSEAGEGAEQGSEANEGPERSEAAEAPAQR